MHGQFGKWTQVMHLKNRVRSEQDLYGDLVVRLPEEKARQATMLVFEAKTADVDIESTRRLVGSVQQRLLSGGKVDRTEVFGSLLRQRVLGCAVHGASRDLVEAAEKMALLMREDANGNSREYSPEAAEILANIFRQ